MEHRPSRALFAPHERTIAVGVVAALGAVVASALGGCPGPDPREAATGGGGAAQSTGALMPTGGASPTGVGGDTESTGALTATLPTTASLTTFGTSTLTFTTATTAPTTTSTMSGCGDTSSDPLNCGACGFVCSGQNTLDPAQPADCVNGKCMPVCAAGFADLIHPGDVDDGCETPARRVFVTTHPKTLPLSVNGKQRVAAGDEFCRVEAAANLVQGDVFRWRAWLSDQEQGVCPVCGPQPFWSGAYVLPDQRTAVAAQFSTFVAGDGTTLLHAINQDSMGGTPTQGVLAWTGTDGTGNPTGADCGGWTDGTSNAPAPTRGRVVATDVTWTLDPAAAGACDAMTVHLYCFEQAM
ncbi:MAG TPA: hypothetical protein VHB21_08350 [Minicystis sp.]|nr:hypothetical protein [Minicystis sp.]